MQRWVVCVLVNLAEINNCLQNLCQRLAKLQHPMPTPRRRLSIRDERTLLRRKFARAVKLTSSSIRFCPGELLKRRPVSGIELERRLLFSQPSDSEVEGSM